MNKQIKAPPKLTRKQKAFADYMLANPKHSATKAIEATYNVTTKNAATQQAFENLRKPNIQNYLAKYDELAQITVVDVMQNSRELKDEPAHARVALDASKDILDRLHGKATQKQEVKSTRISISLGEVKLGS